MKSGGDHTAVNVYPMDASARNKSNRVLPIVLGTSAVLLLFFLWPSSEGEPLPGTG